MVRAHLKTKSEKKKAPKQIKLTNKSQKKSEKSKITLSQNQSTRITRSKSSVELEKTQKTNIDSVQSVSSHTTRLKNKENILPLPNFSPRKTRSKSEKIQSITFDLDSNQQKSSIVNEKKKQQTKICVLSQFVKIIDFKVDSIVLAKQKYSVPWPSKVLKIEKERVFVFFFGDKRSGYVARSEIYDFYLSAKAVKLLVESKKIPRTYCTGIVELEMLMGIPRGESLLNQI